MRDVNAPGSLLCCWLFYPNELYYIVCGGAPNYDSAWLMRVRLRCDKVAIRSEQGDPTGSPLFLKQTQQEGGLVYH